MRSTSKPRIFVQPLAVWERGNLATALTEADLPVGDIYAKSIRFWRFATAGDVTRGFGGLEIYEPDALLRSVVVLPHYRRQGFGQQIVSLLEFEAALSGCREIWLLTTSAQTFFKRLGYLAFGRPTVPLAIRETREFTTLCPASATAMVKWIAYSGAAGGAETMSGDK